MGWSETLTTLLVASNALYAMFRMIDYFAKRRHGDKLEEILDRLTSSTEEPKG